MSQLCRVSALPLFFQSNLTASGALLSLDETTARHVVNVLRMQPGAQMQLTDGLGHAAVATLIEIGKKKATVQLREVIQKPKPSFDLQLGIAFTKNTARNEWLLEKATELGVSVIYPLQTKRSENPRVKEERWQGILTSAMLQSQQYYLPQLSPLTKLEVVFQVHAELRLIAHCEENLERILPNALPVTKSALILIGPEGDFTPDEISLAVQQDFKGLFLGNTRLRTETAAIAACAFLQLHAL